MWVIVVIVGHVPIVESMIGSITVGVGNGPTVHQIVIAIDADITI